jgi:hypothetical protein
MDQVQSRLSVEGRSLTVRYFQEVLRRNLEKEQGILESMSEMELRSYIETNADQFKGEDVPEALPNKGSEERRHVWKPRFLFYSIPYQKLMMIQLLLSETIENPRRQLPSVISAKFQLVLEVASALFVMEG